MKGKNIFSLGLIGIWLLAGCAAPAAPTAPAAATAEPPTAVEPAQPAANLQSGCIDAFDAGVDYFPEKTSVERSQAFDIAYFSHYKVITVREPFPGAAGEVSYLLVQCGTPVPAGYDGVPVIEVPVRNIVAMSTTYLPFLEDLSLLDRLAGVDAFTYINSEAVNDLAAAGKLAEVGSGAEVNVETVLDLDPDLVMTYASGSSDYDAHPKLEEVGVPVVLNADYLDADPLARTEWVKFIAAFFNAEGAADAWFEKTVAEYEALTALTASLEVRPTVLVNTPYEGTWYLPGGQSFFARFLEDAGGDYLWAEDASTSSLFLDFEAVYDQAAAADFWVNIGFYGTLADLQGADARFTEFQAFQEGAVYNNDARQNAAGGFDFYESGVARPQVILADLIKIFHPNLLPDHELVYYRQME